MGARPWTLMAGIGFGESPRWHQDRLWFADWAAKEIVAVDLEGNNEVIVRLSSTSFQAICFDWLPDEHLLAVSSRDGLLLRREADGSLVNHADLSSLSEFGWNEIVVDGRDNTYVNEAGFEFPGGESHQERLPCSSPTARPRRWPRASPSPTGWPRRPTTRP
jgi:sugar lactone lactonase YvrE